MWGFLLASERQCRFLFTAADRKDNVFCFVTPTIGGVSSCVVGFPSSVGKTMQISLRRGGSERQCFLFCHSDEWMYPFMRSGVSSQRRKDNADVIILSEISAVTRTLFLLFRHFFCHSDDWRSPFMRSGVSSQRRKDNADFSSPRRIGKTTFFVLSLRRLEESLYAMWGFLLASERQKVSSQRWKDNADLIFSPQLTFDQSQLYHKKIFYFFK